MGSAPESRHREGRDGETDQQPQEEENDAESEQAPSLLFHR